MWETPWKEQFLHQERLRCNVTSLFFLTSCSFVIIFHQFLNFFFNNSGWKWLILLLQGSLSLSHPNRPASISQDMNQIQSIFSTNAVLHVTESLNVNTKVKTLLLNLNLIAGQTEAKGMVLEWVASLLHGFRVHRMVSVQVSCQFSGCFPPP